MTKQDYRKEVLGMGLFSSPTCLRSRQALGIEDFQLNHHAK